MKVVVFCNKRDFFLTKICIASIRYYHPDVSVYIVKDYLNGNFNSQELEKAMNVKVIDLGIRKYGWSAAKMHFLFSDLFPGELVLTLDSDIVFIGKFLDTLYRNSNGYDFVVNADYADNADTDFVRRHYYDIHYLKSVDPNFRFPGYFFNGGQMLVTTNKLSQDEVIDYFDLGNYPYWKQTSKMPFVDQSLLNYIIPKKEQAGEIKVFKAQFMIWSEGEETKKIEINKVIEGNEYSFLIHWAGALRIPYLKRMTRPDILIFFQEYYYSKVDLGYLKKYRERLMGCADYYLRYLYRQTIKKIIKRWR